MKYFRKHWQKKTVTNLSKVNIRYISDTLWRKHFHNVSLELCQKSVELILFTDFWHISYSAFKVTLYHKCVRNLSNIFFWHISDTFLILLFRLLFTIKLNCQNCVKLILLTDFWHVLVNSMLKAELEMYHKYVRRICLTYFWHICGKE